MFFHSFNCIFISVKHGEIVEEISFKFFTLAYTHKFVWIIRWKSFKRNQQFYFKFFTFFHVKKVLRKSWVFHLLFQWENTWKTQNVYTIFLTEKVASKVSILFHIFHLLSDWKKDWRTYKFFTCFFGKKLLKNLKHFSSKLSLINLNCSTSVGPYHRLC